MLNYFPEIKSRLRHPSGSVLAHAHAVTVPPANNFYAPQLPLSVPAQLKAGKGAGKDGVVLPLAAVVAL